MKPSGDRQIAPQAASSASSPTATAGIEGARSWIKTNGFILGLLAVVGLAFLFPDPGSRNGWMHPELAQNVGIALILFLQGLSMPLEKVRRGSWQLEAARNYSEFYLPDIPIGWSRV